MALYGTTVGMVPYYYTTPISTTLYHIVLRFDKEPTYAHIIYFPWSHRKFRDNAKLAFKGRIKIPKRVIKALHKPKYRHPLLEECPDLRESMVSFGRRVDMMGGRLDINKMHDHVVGWLQNYGETDSKIIRKYQQNPPKAPTMNSYMKALGFKYEVVDNFNGSMNNKWIFVGEGRETADDQSQSGDEEDDDDDSEMDI
jgi:hypothetical protein